MQRLCEQADKQRIILVRDKKDRTKDSKYEGEISSLQNSKKEL